MMDIGQIHRAEYEIDADRSDTLVIAEAPGRLHYLGDHGEARAGLFLSSAINRFVRVAVSPSKDNSIRFYARDIDERKRATLTNLKYKKEDRWANYLKIALRVFADLGFVEKGLNFTLQGDIPQQIGLASSTAIEVATAIALKGFFNAGIGRREIAAKLVKEREAFYGKQSAMVDYAIIMGAQEGSFMAIDETTWEMTQVPVSLSGCKVLLMDSRVPRIDVEQELRLRRHDVKKGLEMLTQRRPGASNLRGFAASELVESTGNLPETLRRRCLFVVQELKRVAEAEDAIGRQDLAALARVMLHSHEGLRDLYEVSCPELDWLVKRAQEIDSTACSRMTGNGFGGCAYTVIKESAAAEYQKRLEDYERIFGFHPIIYDVLPAQGARVVFGDRG